MRKIDFNRGWTFYKAENRAEGGAGSAECQWSESQLVNLPHDAMIWEERDAECRNGKATGYFPGGYYRYTKEFAWKEEYQGKKLFLEFEGVYQNATVFINGEKVYFHPYGYTGFTVDTTPYLKENQANEICVEADNFGEPCTRWYSGSGIYRPVWMYVGEEDYIEVDGVQVTTVSIGECNMKQAVSREDDSVDERSYADSPAMIHVKTLFCEQNAGEHQVHVEIFSEGIRIAEAEGADVNIEIPGAVLWSEETPFLYECRVSLVEEKEGIAEIRDAQNVKFGVRVVTWSHEGLFINGKETKLRGACIHHDNGVLGACEFPQASMRRVRILKEAGFNAVRMAHNPASKAFLTACDELGMYVMDEFTDMWYEHKNRYDYATYFMDWHERDLTAMVRADISHPSVIMYSIGNEVTETAEELGIRLTKEMVEMVHSLDSTRPVTCGINMSLNVMHFSGMGVYQPEPDEPVIDKGQKNPRALALLKEMRAKMQAAAANQPENDSTQPAGQQKTEGSAAEPAANPMDAVGEKGSKKDGKLVGSEYFNKMMVEMKERQEAVVRQEVSKILSEEAYSYLDIAGYNYANARYRDDKEDYPERVSVGSETLPQRIYRNWKLVEELPYVVGDFMWTGWDYLGEAGIGAFCYDSVGTTDKAYPFLLAGSGVIDILGYPRPEVWLNKAAFGLCKEPYIGVEPVTHADENHTISAWRYSDAVHSWSWEGCEGKKAKVIVYADASEVELVLNGVSCGRKKPEECQCAFELEYQPGELLAIAYGEDGREQGRDILKTADCENILDVIVEKESMSADGQDLCYVNIALADKAGIVKASQDTRITVDVVGAAALAGLGSAAPCTEEKYTANNTMTYYGQALAVLRAGYEAGEVLVRVSAEGYEERVIRLRVESK